MINMKKILIYFSFLAVFCLFGSIKVEAQVYSYYGYSTPYYHTNIFKHMTKTDMAIYSINSFFGALDSALYNLEQIKAYERYVQTKSNQIEDMKSLQRYYTEGIPAFSPVTPEGKPRSPKINWQDVDRIH